MARASAEMDELTRVPTIDPADLFRARDGLYASEFLGAAVLGLDLFTRLEKSPSDAKTICRSLGLAARPMDVMLTLLSAMALVENRKGIFQVTQKAREFLVRESPWFLGPYYASFAERPVYQMLMKTLRTGKSSVFASRDKGKAWAQAMENEAFAQEFTKTMDARGAYLGPMLARALDLMGRKRLLDVGGGSGIYACSVVAAHPQMRATVLEKSPVDRAARACIAARGLSERVDVISGDMFAERLPAECDVHLWSNALHDWDAPLVKTLLGKSFEALPAGGMVVIHDAHVNRERNGPLTVAAYSVFIMASTEGKCYSIGEMEDFLGEAGFEGVEFHRTAVDHSAITARKPG
jgi:predicted O-methyltransferase YrrM